MSKKTKLTLTPDEVRELDMLVTYGKYYMLDVTGVKPSSSVELKVAEAYAATMLRKHYAERALNG